MRDLIPIEPGMIYCFERKPVGNNYYLLHKTREELSSVALYAVTWQPNLPSPKTGVVILTNDYFIAPNEPFMIVEEKTVERCFDIQTKYIKVLTKSKLGWLRITEGAVLKQLEEKDYSHEENCQI